MLLNKYARELAMFPHIAEIGMIKNTSIRFNGFEGTRSHTLKIYTIQEGKFEWKASNHKLVLLPGDTMIILPGMELCSEDNILEIGAFCWIHLDIGSEGGHMSFNNQWSRLSLADNHAIGNAFRMNDPAVLHQFYEASEILKTIQKELFEREIGFQTRVNNLIDEILIQIARQFTRFIKTGRNFPKVFMELEEALRRDLTHQWTVEEMAGLVGLGTTVFNEKVKSFSGFTPLNYLINIRITESVKLIKNPDISLTDIALDTGFYSSQHFSTTFKKLTGYTPSQFRKNHMQSK